MASPDECDRFATLLRSYSDADSNNNGGRLRCIFPEPHARYVAANYPNSISSIELNSNSNTDGDIGQFTDTDSDGDIGQFTDTDSHACSDADAF